MWLRIFPISLMLSRKLRAACRCLSVRLIGCAALVRNQTWSQKQANNRLKRVDLRPAQNALARTMRNQEYLIGCVMSRHRM
jgi:hypothetical protein